MSTFEYQRVLARLVVDDSFYEEYTKDPSGVAAKIGVAESTQALLAKLDQAGVKTFREVIQGSRSTTFHLVLDELSRRITDDEWVTLIRKFHRDVVVKDSGRWNDLGRFCDWLDQEFPYSRGATIARYQYLTQVMGSARPNTISSTSVQTTAKLAWLISAFDFEELFDDSIPIWKISESDTRHNFLLKGNYSDDDLEVLEVDARTVGTLMFLRTPRPRTELQNRLELDESAVSELIAQYSDLGLIDARQA